MDAYLELTKSPELIISFMSDDPDNAEARESLCRALVRHGFIDKALEIAESQVDVDEQNSLKLTDALARMDSVASIHLLAVVPKNMSATFAWNDDIFPAVSVEVVNSYLESNAWTSARGSGRD